MVTARAQYNLRTARRYFEEHLKVGDYYAQGQNIAGEFIGVGAERLGLNGCIRAEEFLALCDNVDPRTGKRLTVRTKSVRVEDGASVANRRIFYDFTFSPPKSVSIAALVSGDERLGHSHQRALKVALGELERFVGTRIRRHGANESRATGNLVGALFTHNTSRAVDPHLHTHCIVFNATFDPVEQHWKALQNYEMVRARKFIENLYYHELAKDLHSFGYSIRNKPRPPAAGSFSLAILDNMARSRHPTPWWRSNATQAFSQPSCNPSADRIPNSGKTVRRGGASPNTGVLCGRRPTGSCASPSTDSTA